jgi:hypothetical protein
MPTVPEPTRERVKQRGIAAPTGGVRVPLPAVGAGQEIAGLLEDVRQEAAQETGKAKRTRLAEAVSDLLANGTRLKEDYATNYRGKNAIAQADNFLSNYEESYNGIREGIADEEVRTAFHIEYLRHKQTFNAFVQRHQSQQGEVYSLEERGKLRENYHNEAMIGFRDERAVENAIAGSTATIMQFAHDFGKGEEWAKAEIATDLSSIRRGVVFRYLAAGDHVEGKAYFDQHKSEMTGQDRKEAEAAVNRYSVLGEAQMQADTIAAIHASPEAMRQEVRDIKDPQVRQMTSRLVEQRIAEDEALQRERHANAFDRGLALIRENPGVPVETLLTPEDRLVLTNKDLYTLDRFVVVPERNDDERVVRFFAEYVDSPEGRKKLADVPPSQFYGDFWVHLDKEWRPIVKKFYEESQKPESRFAFETESATLKGALDRLGLVPEGYDEMDREDKKKWSALQANFRKEAIRRFDAEPDADKRRRNEIIEEMEAEVVTTKHVDVPWWAGLAFPPSPLLGVLGVELGIPEALLPDWMIPDWFTEEEKRELWSKETMEAEGIEATDANDIPEGANAAIIRDITERGRTVTDDLRLRLFSAWYLRRDQQEYETILGELD